MPSTKLKAVVWDMDGLLLDSERVSFVAWKHGAESIGETIDESAFAELIGRTSQGIIDKLEELLGSTIDIPKLCEQATIRYYELIESGVPLKAGARQCLELLSELNIPQALATSSKLNIAEKKLGHHDLLNHFQTLVTGDQVVHGKPSPEPYLLAAKRLGIDAENCIAFEDSVNGLLSAYDAGMRTVLVPDLSIHDKKSLNRAWKQLASLEEAVPLLRAEFS